MLQASLKIQNFALVARMKHSVIRGIFPEMPFREVTSRIIKALAVLGLSTLICSQVCAETIELNNKSPAQCRKQLMSAPTANIVVAAYYAECHWWQSFKPNYEKVSGSLNFPGTYYKFDFLAANPGVATSCLKMKPQYSPTVLVYAKSKKGYSLLRSTSGYKNAKELAKFISK